MLSSETAPSLSANVCWGIRNSRLQLLLGGIDLLLFLALRYGFGGSCHSFGTALELSRQCAIAFGGFAQGSRGRDIVAACGFANQLASVTALFMLTVAASAT